MEPLKHECGVAMVRLLKPLAYYREKYGSWQYGLNKLYLLMEKQHNRGQEGAGICAVNLTMPAGGEYIFRERATGTNAIQEVFERIGTYAAALPKEKFEDPAWAGENLAFAGETLMGHLRYSTTGRSGLTYIHPFLKRSNWKSRNLLVCGNFNLTNVDEIFSSLLHEGQHPRLYADTFLILETIGSRLDRQIQQLQIKWKNIDQAAERNIRISEDTDISRILKESAAGWDGGYVICGITGDAHSFALRDPWGIRTAFYYHDEEVAVLASERPVIQTAFNVDINEVKELQPGEAFILDNKGKVTVTQILPPHKATPCSFERIYFSRGSDADIYQERKTLGRQLLNPILKVIDKDLENTVFSFIPNTAEVAFFGMMEGFEEYLTKMKKDLITPDIKLEELEKILSLRVRQEKVAIKDIKLRTFIAEDADRDDLATHVYDITYGSLVAGRDNLVVIDDSIVRGTTLRQSIIKILDRLGPKKIVIVSSSPQIRYPDCYGIDMSSMNEFIAFRAAISLLQEKGMESRINEIYALCKAQQDQPKEEITNHVKKIYEPFTQEEISDRIACLLTPAGTKAEVKIVYQTVEGLHKACPNHSGDWYFTGNYPTPGGNKMVNNAFIKYMENS